MEENPRENLDTCAAAVTDTFPMVMHTIRDDLKANNAVSLSMQQFRALKYLQRRQGATLTELTDHVGGTLSAVSKLVDGLVERGLLAREPAETDRRRVALRVTDDGKDMLDEVHHSALTTVKSVLGPLKDSERALVTLAMGILQESVAAYRALKPDRDEQDLP